MGGCPLEEHPLSFYVHRGGRGQDTERPEEDKGAMGKGKDKSRTGTGTGLRDKHLKLDQEKLDRARQILGARTERETVERALDLVVSEAELDRLLRELKGKGTLRRVFR